MKTYLKKASHFCFLLFKGLAISTCAMAQNGYHVEHYTSENGLPQNSVKSIAMDAEGFIWLATEDGLVRFDGHRFYVFNQSNLNIKSNRVHHISPARRDRASSGGSNKRLYFEVDFEMHEPILIENGKTRVDSVFNANFERHMTALGINNSTVQYVRDVTDSNIDWALTAKYIVFTGSDKGNFYLCDTSHVSYYRNWKQEYEINYQRTVMWSHFSLSERLYYFRDKKEFIKVQNGKITKFAIKGDILQQPEYYAGNSGLRLFWNNNSQQAFLYFDRKLYLLAEQKNGDLITRLLIENFDLNSNGIETVYFEETSRKVYLGSRTDGLFVITRKRFWTLRSSGDNLANAFYAQLSYGANQILTPNGTILGNDTLKHRTLERNLRVLQQANPIDKQVIIRDKNAAIWIKMYENLFYMDKNADAILGKWRMLSAVRSIIQGADGKIWLATVDQGLYSIDPDHTEKGPERFAKDSLKNITYMSALGARQLLVGTISGLYKVDILTKKIRLVGKTNGLHIKSIYVMDADNIWLTVLKKGLALMDGSESMVTFPMDRNRYLASPHCIVNDGNGFFWIPTNRGLFQIAIADLLSYRKLVRSAGLDQGSPPGNRVKDTELLYLYHTMEEGFNTNEFNGGCQPCALRLANGIVSLPSLNGFVWFNPKKMNNYVPAGNTILDKIEVNQKAIPGSGDTIRLSLRPENVKFYFSTVNEGNDYNLKVSYKLTKQGDANDQSSWILLENNDLTVRYSSLASGRYTLLVRKLKGFGIKNYNVKRIDIIVPQEWYETAWAKTLFASIFLICLVLFTNLYSNYRLASAARENKKLEQVILQRTASLNQALHNVEQSKAEMGKQMHLFSRLLTSISHDIQSPLKYIGFATRRIPGIIENNQLQKASSLGITIAELSDRMGGMLGDLLDYIKVQVYGNQLNLEEISLKKLVDEKLELFKDAIRLNGSNFVNDVSSVQMVFSDYQFLAIIIHNLIDNAAKYTYHGEIRIYCVASQDYKLELVISNTGTGVSSALLEMMNRPIKDKNLDELMESGRMTGLGLLMVKEMAELAGITIKVTQTNITSFHLFFN